MANVIGNFPEALHLLHTDYEAIIVAVLNTSRSFDVDAMTDDEADEATEKLRKTLKAADEILGVVGRELQGFMTTLAGTRHDIKTILIDINGGGDTLLQLQERAELAKPSHIRLISDEE